MTEQELINIIKNQAVKKSEVDRAFLEASLIGLDEPRAITFEEADKLPLLFDWNKIYWVYAKRFGDKEWHETWAKAMGVVKETSRPKE